MFSRFILFTLFLSLFISSVATAQTVLLTVVGNEDSAKTTWWPDKSYIQTDDWLRHALENYGIQAIDPLADNSIRFSPVVYAAGPLTRSNAKSLGSLYHADMIITGSLKWSCTPTENAIHCPLDATLTLASVKDAHHKDISIHLDAEAPTEDLARKYAVSMLASKLSTS
ncbi:MAG: hypothetical protein II180_02405, partial [Proteobacteria bacterium]|nr:hypothetical protein [Pseudomonadota bacterium]